MSVTAVGIASLITAIVSAGAATANVVAEKKAEDKYQSDLARETAMSQGLAGRAASRTARQNERYLGQQKREQDRAWKWKEEDRDYRRGMNLTNKIFGMINNSQAAKNMNSNRWRKSYGRA